MTLPTRFRTIVACALLATAAVAVSPSFAQSPAPPVAKPISLDRAYASFGFAMLRELRMPGTNDNLFLSPPSLAIALSMAANGARGATQSAILTSLYVSDRSVAALNAQNQALITDMNTAKGVKLSLADALWVQQSFAVNPAFQTALKTYYGAHAQNIDFRSPNAVGTINGWVAKNTNDRVKKIVDQIDPSTVLMLTNAIAFKATWDDPFLASATTQQDFTDASGAAHTMPLMQRTGTYDYAKTGDLESIRLPYDDDAYAMYVVLASKPPAFESFVHDLTPETFEKMRSSLASERGKIELPRFTIDYGASMNRALENVGMGEAFSDAADFGGIHSGQPKIAISEVRHASFLKVDEEGTEAAAATSVGMRTLAMPPMALQFHMVVNHPFFVAIRDEKSGQLLFIGTIANPQG